jgi:methylmalonyl-CoA mutase N-terminal domain/subunit
VFISVYHIREAGSTAAQEAAFTLADGFAYVEAGIDRGLDVDAFAPLLSFFFNSHNSLFEEVAKFRAARRVYAAGWTTGTTPPTPSQNASNSTPKLPGNP